MELTITEIELLKIANDIAKEDRDKNIGYTIDGILSVYQELKQKLASN